MSVFPPETISLIAEAVGISNVSEAITTTLCSDVEYRLRETIQEAMKFARHARRQKITTDDINNALRVRNVEPLYGFKSNEPLQFKAVPNMPPNARPLYYVEDREVDLADILNAPLPKCPVDVTYTAHWLAVEGVQPAIPENPQVVITNQTDMTKLPSQPPMDATSAAASATQGPTSAISTMAQGTGIATETKPLVKHVLSRELQLYYEKMTEAIIGTEERLRDAALEGIAKDPGLQQLLPYLVQFVVDKVATNGRNLPVLTSVMRLCGALLANKELYLDWYLHQLLQALMTCLLKKALSQSPTENHWALRDYAASLVAQVCRRWSGDPQIQVKVTRQLVRGLLETNKALTTNYGAVVGLASLGHNVVRVLLLPNLRAYSTILEPALSAKNTNPQKRDEAARVQAMLIEAVGGCLRAYAQAAKKARGGATAVPAEHENNWRAEIGEWYEEVLGMFGEKLLTYVDEDNAEVLMQLEQQTRQQGGAKLIKKKKEKKTLANATAAAAAGQQNGVTSVQNVQRRKSEDGVGGGVQQVAGVGSEGAPMDLS